MGVREADGWVGMIDAGWLRGLGEEGLASLLRRRPEVLAPPVPASLAELAERLGTPGSVLAALRRLDRPTLHVAEAIAALGGQTDRMALDRLLGATDADTVQAVSGALDTLRGNALLAVDPALILVPAGCAAWPRPLGLGPAVADMLPLRTADDLRAFARNLGIKPATRKAALLAQVTAALRDPDTVCATVDQAPAPVRDLLYKVAATGEAMHDFDYYSPRYGQVRTPVQWAVARGMLVRASDWDSGLVMPAEVALALRGPAYTAPFDLVPPTVDRAPADMRHVA